MFGIILSGKRFKYFCIYFKVYGYSIERCYKLNFFGNGIRLWEKWRRIIGNVFVDGYWIDIIDLCVEVNDFGFSNIVKEKNEVVFVFI